MLAQPDAAQVNRPEKLFIAQSSWVIVRFEGKENIKKTLRKKISHKIKKIMSKEEKRMIEN